MLYLYYQLQLTQCMVSKNTGDYWKMQHSRYHLLTDISCSVSSDAVLQNALSLREFISRFILFDWLFGEVRREEKFQHFCGILLKVPGL